MNWYKKSQQDINQQYNQMLQQSNGVQIIGSGQNEMINIPGSSKRILARELLERVKSRLASFLIQNHVHTIDTSPVNVPNAQGLAISHEPSIIHIDVRKIFENAKKALPSTSQLDGVETDPDIINGLIQRVSQWLESEITGTASHEATHRHNFTQLWQQGKPFTQETETAAERAGEEAKRRYFPNTI